MRAADTYRGARRNAVLRGKPRGMWQGIDKARDRDGNPIVKYIEPPPVRANKRDRSKDGMFPALRDVA